MKKIIPLSLVCLSLLAMNACKSPTKAAVKHKTGIGKGPVEKAEDNAEKKVKNTKKDLEKKKPDLQRD